MAGFQNERPRRVSEGFAARTAGISLALEIGGIQRKRGSIEGCANGGRVSDRDEDQRPTGGWHRYRERGRSSETKASISEHSLQPNRHRLSLTMLSQRREHHATRATRLKTTI